ncbi:MAG TPA: DnaA/Hda family protein [Candidatus Hydrogenedentes bacterium]|nr:DnaA/Hda family protein [Candidatus Hydrogenedentota bacterium]HOS02119.1 DnaA/Hda family protein [Candidatus Hydrogenedentota bacterium]
MKRYTFGAFLVDDTNRQAYDACLRIAERDPEAPKLTVLVGEEGCGKTHLLYSIVNHVRAASVRVGLACVTAQNLPEQVRALIEDPSPLDRIRHAILLVDQLEQIDGIETRPDMQDRPGQADYLIEELQAVIHIFLDKGHRVVIASNVYPAHLRSLSESAKQRIAEGDVIPIAPIRPENRMDVLTQRAAGESEEIIRRQQQEIAELRALLENASAKPSPYSSGEAGSATSDRAAREDAERKLAVAKAHEESLRQELADAERQLQTLREVVDVAAKGPAPQEWSHLHADLDLAHAQAAAAAQDAERLHGDLRRLEAERQEMASFRTQLEESERRIAALDAEKRSLSDALEAARQDSQRAREEANGLLGRAQRLLDQIEANRALLAQTEAEHVRQIQQLEMTLAAGVPAAAAQDELRFTREQVHRVQAQLEAQEAVLVQERARFEQEIADVQRNCKAEIEQAHMDRDVVRSERDELRQQRDEVIRDQQQLLAAIERTKQERDALDEEIDGLRASRDLMQARIEEASSSLGNVKKELDALRVEAAEEVARAHAQAGELENRLVRTATLLRETRAHGKTAAQEMVSWSTRLAEVANAFGQLGKQLDETMASIEPEAPIAPSYLDEDETPEDAAMLRKPFDQADFDEAFARAAEYADETGDRVVVDEDRLEAPQSPHESPDVRGEEDVD